MPIRKSLLPLESKLLGIVFTLSQYPWPLAECQTGSSAASLWMEECLGSHFFITQLFLQLGRRLCSQAAYNPMTGGRGLPEIILTQGTIRREEIGGTSAASEVALGRFQEQGNSLRIEGTIHQNKGEERRQNRKQQFGYNVEHRKLRHVRGTGTLTWLLQLTNASCYCSPKPLVVLLLSA